MTFLEQLERAVNKEQKEFNERKFEQAEKMKVIKSEIEQSKREIEKMKLEITDEKNLKRQLEQDITDLGGKYTLHKSKCDLLKQMKKFQTNQLDNNLEKVKSHHWRLEGDFSTQNDQKTKELEEYFGEQFQLQSHREETLQRAINDLQMKIESLSGKDYQASKASLQKMNQRVI